MRVEHAGLVHHVALLDARGFFNELNAGMGQRLALAGFDLRGKLGVLADQRRR